jgi:hypothetical protein
MIKMMRKCLREEMKNRIRIISVHKTNKEILSQIENNKQKKGKQIMMRMKIILRMKIINSKMKINLELEMSFSRDVELLKIRKIKKIMVILINKRKFRMN